MYVFEILFNYSDNNINKSFTFSESGFHSWIEIDNWFIDFTSSLLPEIAADAGLHIGNRYMLRKKLSEEAPSPFKLSKEKRFYLAADPVFTRKRIDFVFENERYFNVVQECIYDYSSNNVKIYPDLSIAGSW